MSLLTGERTLIFSDSIDFSISRNSSSFEYIFSHSTGSYPFGFIITAMFFSKEIDWLWVLSIFALTSDYLRDFAIDHYLMNWSNSSYTLLSCNFLFWIANSNLEILLSMSASRILYSERSELVSCIALDYWLTCKRKAWPAFIFWFTSAILNSLMICFMSHFTGDSSFLE